MPIQKMGESGILAYFEPKVCHFGHIFWDMDFKFVLPIINIDIDSLTKGRFKDGILVRPSPTENKFLA